jgi:tRNA dimethylallyltransferase
MSPDKTQLPLVAVIGPTASGKSALAVWLAERLGGQVVVCDSTQLYRGFDIGTVKPTPAERRGIPHHLIDVLNADENATAGDYRRRAIAILDMLRQAACVPIFTVGTGLYLRALLEGLAESPERSEQLRERLRVSAAEHDPGHLYKLLKHLDAAASRKIAPADEQKLIRAIEVCLLAKKPLSQVHQAARAPLTGWRVLKLGLLPKRELLYDRIHKRTDAMLVRGWMDEVHGLISSGLPENAKPLDFIGYRELRAVIRGEMSFEQARAAIQQATRRYAKRQVTWFRKEVAVHWLPGFGDDPAIQSQAFNLLQENGVVKLANRHQHL